MEIDFEIDGAPARYSRNWFTGLATLSVAGKPVTLQSVWNPATHFSFPLKRSWTMTVQGHNVVIEKVRPLLLAGLRPQSYRITIDGVLVAETTGY
jgi:hypothetical protein